MKPLTISVVILTNDRPVLLRHALRSLDRQTVKPYETVIVDDSRRLRAETRKVIHTEAPRPYVVVRNTEHSVTYGRRIGARTARGTVVANLDDDCVLPPGHLRHVLQHFMKDSALAAVFGRIRNAIPQNPYAATQFAYYERGLTEYFPSFIVAAPLRFGRILDDELLAAKRQDLIAFGYPPVSPRWFRNNDVELGCWYVRNGRKVLFDPSMTALAYPRTSLRDLCIAAWTNGYSDAVSEKKLQMSLGHSPYPSRFFPWWFQSVRSSAFPHPAATALYAFLLILFPVVTRMGNLWYRLTHLP